MAFLPAEVKRIEALSEEMVKLIENKDTSGEASVTFSKIGRICTRALADHAALAAKRSTRAEKTNKFQAARKTRQAAKKGGAAASSPAQGSTQKTA